MSNSIVGTEYLPNAHIQSIIFQRFETHSRASVTVNLYDFQQRTWSADEKFIGYFNVLILICRNKETINDLLLGNIDVNSNLQQTTKIKIPFSAHVNQGLVQIRDTNYREFKYKHDFMIQGNAEDVACFAVCEMNVEDMILNERLDLSFSPIKNFLGPLECEQILKENAEFRDSLVFYDSDGVPWAGPVHRMPTGPVMAGSTHGELEDKILTSQTLTGVSKIQYFSEGSLNIMEISNTEEQDYSRASNFYYCTEFLEDEARNVSFTTILDLENFYLSESRIARTVYEHNPDLFYSIAELSNVKHIEVERSELSKISYFNAFNLRTSALSFTPNNKIAKSNNNNRKVKSKTLYKISPREIVSVNPAEVASNKKSKFFNGKNLSKEMLQNSKKIGKVEQINLSMPPNFRPINVTDYSINEITEGKFKYALKVSVEDEFLKYTKQILQDMLRYHSKIESLINSVQLKNVFINDKFLISFISEFYSQYGIVIDTEKSLVEGEFATPQLMDSYLYKSFETLDLAEKILGIDGRAGQLVNSLNLFSTTIDNMRGTLQYYSEIISSFKDRYDLADGLSYEKSSSKSRKDRGMIEKTVVINKEYERKMILPIGISYIAKSNPEGMPFINASQFNTRATKEVDKFFKGGLNKDSEEISKIPANLRQTFANVERDKFKNFSPTRISLAGKHVDTETINPESFDADFFNTLRVVKSAFRDSQNIENQESFQDDEDELSEELTDSRNFLGGESVFNRRVLMLQNQRKFPKLVKARKKFSFLDNKVLKSNNTKISLDSFDVNRPDNIIYKNLKSDPNKIPIQMKALSLLRTPITNFDLKDIDFDPLANPQTQEVFEQNYLNIGTVEYLEGFERLNGLYSLSQPIYKEIEYEELKKIENINVLCRVTDNSYNSVSTDTSAFNVYDKVFVMSNTEEEPETMIDRENLETQQFSETVETENFADPSAQAPTLAETGPVIMVDYNDLAPSDYSNTIVVQNPENVSVVSSFGLSESKQVDLEANIVVPTDLSSQTTVDSGGSIY